MAFQTGLFIYCIFGVLLQVRATVQYMGYSRHVSTFNTRAHPFIFSFVSICCRMYPDSASFKYVYLKLKISTELKVTDRVAMEHGP